MATINTAYVRWNTTQLLNWILSIDSSYEYKYKHILSKSLTQKGITGGHINDLDREDLKEYGIINLSDRKTIYAAIQKLIVNKKRRDSLQMIMTSNYTEATENIVSLSDDDETTVDHLTLLTDIQRKHMTTNGYCVLDDPLNNDKTVYAVQGYIRNNFHQLYMIKDLIHIVINYYNSRYNPQIYIEIICNNLDNNENINYSTFLVPKINISLSKVLNNRMESVTIGNRIEIDVNKVSNENMDRILKYLGHHKGIQPDAIVKPIRSVKMEHIVDLWDAQYINSFSKKVIFQMILAANYLDCASLLHLGAAKIATLIKGKSPEEIRNILADDGK